MFNMSATLIGAIGSAFLATSFVPGVLNEAPPAGSSHGPAPLILMQRVAADTKGDRVVAPQPAANRALVSVVELVGLSQATVILKSASGEVLYRSDPQTNTTYFSKDTDMPVITLKETPQSPVVQQPVSRRETQDQTEKKRRPPVGCLASVSPLAQAYAEQTPSLCLAHLDQPLSRS